MTIYYYSYLLSLLFLLLITHWSHTASLRSQWSLDRRNSSLIVNNEVTTPEPILSRRRPQLTSNERRRRWSKDEDNDEVEIPIDETNNFTNDNESIILSDDTSLFNSTMISIITEIKHPLLRQDLATINQTDELTSIENNENLTTSSNEISTQSEILPTNVTDINQEISNEKNESIIDNLTTAEIINNEVQTSSIPISINQTIEETSTISQTELLTTNDLKQDTAIILLDYTTIPPDATDTNQTLTDSGTESISQYNTTVTDEDINPSTVLDVTKSDTTSIQEGIDNTTIKSDTTKNDIEVTDQGIVDTTIISDVTQSETSTISYDEDEYSNETVVFIPTTTAKPVCDRSCQCLKECPYGFEIVKDVCQCDPPCKNYQCYGNDTCTAVKGKPICQPQKGSKHDRPIQCYQPRDAGYHDTDMRYHNRWYYNPEQDTCHLFVYRGLGGNENNYPTLHDCHVECITCAPPPDRGECLGYIPMWYYDYKKNQCLQFNYSGCKGNENKFLRKQDCIDACITRILNL